MHIVFIGLTNAVAPTVAPTSSASSCSSNLCNNRGICQQVGYGTGIQCYCSAGWSGTRCQYSKSNFQLVLKWKTKYFIKIKTSKKRIK